MGAQSEAPRGAASVLIRIRGAMPALRPAEQRVAAAVLADPAGVSESSITVLAKACATSETTVLRFCRAVGLSGYPELRIALARAAQWEEEAHGGQPRVSGDISEADSLADLVAKIIRADARAVEDTEAAMDMVALQRAVDALTAARRVDIYGIGASALVAYDLHQKLHRIGLVSFSWNDPQLCLTSAAVLTPEDVAIGISHTGTTNDTIDALHEARNRGATTIAITNFASSPLAMEADVVLTTAARETTFRTGALTSRVSQLAVIDCLYAGVAQRSYNSSLHSVDEALAAVESRHSGRRLP
jgi:DNA-binding MurR/RpiR family transcriptional regulator